MARSEEPTAVTDRPEPDGCGPRPTEASDRKEGSVLALVGAGAIALAAEVIAWTTVEEDSWPVLAMAAAAILIGGVPTLLGGLRSLRSLRLDIDLLMAVPAVELRTCYSGCPRRNESWGAPCIQEWLLLKSPVPAIRSIRPMSFASFTRPRSFAWLIAGLVAFALSLGAHRSLVVCSGPHCAGAIEWAHDPGQCCVRLHSEQATCGHVVGEQENEGGDCEGDTVRPGHGCSDVPLLLDDGPAPKRVAFATPPGNAAAIGEDWIPTPLPAGHPVREHAPATGPPRPPQALTLLATTVLLI